MDSAPHHGDDSGAALAPLLGDCFVILAQLFAAMQFIGEQSACRSLYTMRFSGLKAHNQAQAGLDEGIVGSNR